MHMNVDSSFICNNPKLLTTQKSFNRWMVKRIVVHLYHGTPCIKRKQTTDTCKNIDESPDSYVK